MELDQELCALYKTYKTSFYRTIREGNLSPMEAFTLDLIGMMEEPTAAEFARSMGISAPNASYKVNQLIEKGYLEKVQSEKDHRNYTLKVRENWKPCLQQQKSIAAAISRIQNTYSQEQIELLTCMLGIIREELQS